MDERDEFYPKFVVTRRDTGEEVDPHTCFTLVPAHDPAAVQALHVYVEYIAATHPNLAEQIERDLIEPNL